MAKTKRKQVSIEFIEHTQRTITDLLSSPIPQFAKQKLCIIMEKLLKELKQKDDDYQYLYWLRYGKIDWEAEKETHLAKLSVGATIKIPKEYITGPDYNGDDEFVSDIQGEWSRAYY